MIKSGYITVEACIAIPITICIIMSIAGLIKIAYVHQTIRHAMYESAAEFSMNSYLFNKLEIYDSGKQLSEKFKSKFDTIKKFGDLVGVDTDEYIDKILNEEYNKLGIELYKIYFNSYYPKSINVQVKDIDFSNSRLSEDEIYINLKYNIINPLPIEYLGKINISDGLFLKTFDNGKSLYENADNYEVIEIYYDLWELDNWNRGKAIGDLLGNNLGYMFYGIDKLENNELTSIVSVDTRKKTYNFDDGLYKRAKEKIDELHDFTVGTKGGITINKTDYKYKIINLVIPDEDLSNDQLKELEEARRYAKELDINFKITVIKKKEDT